MRIKLVDILDVVVEDMVVYDSDQIPAALHIFVDKALDTVQCYLLEDKEIVMSLSELNTKIKISFFLAESHDHTIKFLIIFLLEIDAHEF